MGTLENIDAETLRFLSMSPCLSILENKVVETKFGSQKAKKNSNKS